jgi:hypothetical protein
MPSLLKRYADMSSFVAGFEMRIMLKTGDPTYPDLPVASVLKLLTAF